MGLSAFARCALGSPTRSFLSTGDERGILLVKKGSRFHGANRSSVRSVTTVRKSMAGSDNHTYFLAVNLSFCLLQRADSSTCSKVSSSLFQRCVNHPLFVGRGVFVISPPHFREIFAQAV